MLSWCIHNSIKLRCAYKLEDSHRHEMNEDNLLSYITPGTLMTSAAADVINHNGRNIGRFKTYTILLGKDDLGSIVEPKSSLVWTDVILADIQRVISRYLQYISTGLSCTAQRVLRTIFMQKSKPKYACLPSKVVEVWIDGLCVRYDWWRRLQPTSSVSREWYVAYWLLFDGQTV